MSMTTSPPGCAGMSHPVGAAVDAAVAALADVVGAAVWSMRDGEVCASLDSLDRLDGMSAEVRSRVLTQLQTLDLPRRSGASSAAAWLRATRRHTPGAAKRQLDLAAGLGKYGLVRDELASGRLHADQAKVIIGALDALPDDVDPDALALAEKQLVGFADEFDAIYLTKLGNRILDLVDPDHADRAEADRLRREQERANRTRELTFSRDGHGSVFIRGKLTTEAAAIVQAALDPLAKPLPADPDTGTRDPRTAGARRADALVELSRRSLKAGGLPSSGGLKPQLRLTIDLDKLRASLGSARLDSGEAISAETARRLACDADLIPAVLGTGSTILDLGRTQRLFTPAQRQALILRDGGCAFPSCDRPPEWCEGHHLRHWLDGGDTSLANGVLLCGYHHHVIHQNISNGADWTVRMAADGHPEFIPPRWPDPDRKPQRNRLHRL